MSTYISYRGDMISLGQMNQTDIRLKDVDLQLNQMTKSLKSLARIRKGEKGSFRNGEFISDIPELRPKSNMISNAVQKVRRWIYKVKSWNKRVKPEDTVREIENLKMDLFQKFEGICSAVSSHPPKDSEEELAMSGAEKQVHQLRSLFMDAVDGLNRLTNTYSSNSEDFTKVKTVKEKFSTALAVEITTLENFFAYRNPSHPQEHSVHASKGVITVPSQNGVDHFMIAIQQEDMSCRAPVHFQRLADIFMNLFQQYEKQPSFKGKTDKIVTQVLKDLT